MSTFTIEVPDDLAVRLTPLRDQLPTLLTTVLEFNMPVSKARQSQIRDEDAPVFRELIDFLASSPRPEQILAFKISPAAQARLSDLLYKNREASLTPAEETELDLFEQAEHFMILLKARARTLVHSVN